MLQILSWYAVIQLAGVLAYPMAWRLFPGLPDRGYCFSKHLGILLTGFCLWLGCACGMLPNEEGGAWLAIVLLGAAALTSARAGLQENQQGFKPLAVWLKDNWSQVVWVEGLFLAAFAFWLWIRAYDPAISHTEQPMDLMFLSAIHASPSFPPRDAWLAGYSISYYYFGYWLLSTFAFLSGQAPEAAYNLGQASWFAMLILGSFGIGSNLARMASRGDTQRCTGGAVSGPAIGLLSAAAVGIVGNLEFLLEWLNQRGIGSKLIAWFAVPNMPPRGVPPGGWWWWRSSRVLSDRDLMGRPIEIIDEFPFFSYLLGDNHPHLLSMPFLLLLIGIALNFVALQARAKGSSEESPSSLRRVFLGFDLPSLSLISISLSSLALLNTWDLVPGVLLIALLFFCSESRHGTALLAFLRTLALAGLLILSMLALCWPFLTSVQSSVTGVRPNLFHPTRAAHFILMFGALIPGLMALFWCAWRHSRPTLREFLFSLTWVWGATTCVFSVGLLWVVATAPGRKWLEQVTTPLKPPGHLDEIVRRWWHDPFVLLFLGLGLALGISLLRRSIRPPGSPPRQITNRVEAPAYVFALILAVVGILLLCLPELSYLQDSFGTRMNTVFKVYYQAWLLLALASAFGCARALKEGKAGQVFALLGFAALMAGMAYPAAAIPSKIGQGRADSGSLSGIAHWSDDELNAVRWIRANVPKTAVVVEGPGTSYDSGTSRVSAATGRSTLLGWPGHEMQWRGDAYSEMAGSREGILQSVYASATASDLLTLLRSSNIDFLYVGPVERLRYKITPDRERRLEDVMRVVFESGSVRIYRPRF